MTMINVLINEVGNVSKQAMNQEKQFLAMQETLKQQQQVAKKQIEDITGQAVDVIGELGNTFFRINKEDYSYNTINNIIQKWKQERNQLMNTVNRSLSEKVPGAIAIFDQNTDFLKIQNASKRDIFNIDLKKKKNTTEFIMTEENMRMLGLIWQVVKTLL